MPAEAGSLSAGNATSTAPLGPNLGPDLQAEAGAQADGTSWIARICRVVLVPIKFVWGMALCQGLIGSLIVVGWTYRLTERSVLKYWWSKSSASHKGESFASFVAKQESTKMHRRWPNWILAQDFSERIRRKDGVSWWRHFGAVLKALVQSLWSNFRLGLQAIFNTAVLTLPACLLWWFGWYDGWNNSFNKGYEQAAVGPVISLFGIFWFIAAMFYVPLAQARQAATGDWRSFYQFRLIWALVRARWIWCVALAFLYAAFALPLNIMKTAPMFWAQNEVLTDAAALKRLNDYFFRCALWMLPAYVVLRLAAGRIYGSGVLALVRRGVFSRSDLAASEAEYLDHLGLLERRAERERHVLVRLAAWTGTRVGRVCGFIVLAVTWFLFVSQMYIAEFFNHHSALGWLNQPLVQLPWFHYVPARLKNPGGELFLLMLILFVGWVAIRVGRKFRGRAS